MLIRLAPWIFVVLWSTGFIGMRAAAPFIEPLTFLSIRFVLVVVILLIALPLFRIPLLPWRDAGRAMFVGAWLHGVYLGGVMFAIKHGMPAGVVALIISMQPVLTTVCAGTVLGEEIRARHWLGLLLGVVGTSLVLLPRLEFTGWAFPPETIGAALVGLCGITFATLYQKSRASHLDLRASLLPQFAGAAVVTTILAFALETREVIWSVELVLALAWLVLVLSLGAISLLLFLLRENAVWRTSTLFYLIPPATALFAWALFGEHLNIIQIGGMAVTMTAVFAVRPRPTPGT